MHLSQELGKYDVDFICPYSYSFIHKRTEKNREHCLSAMWEYHKQHPGNQSPEWFSLSMHAVAGLLIESQYGIQIDIFIGISSWIGHSG